MQHLTHPSGSLLHISPPSPLSPRSPFFQSVSWCMRMSLTGRWERDSSNLFNSIKQLVCLSSPQIIICSWWEELFSSDGTWRQGVTLSLIEGECVCLSGRERKRESIICVSHIPASVSTLYGNQWKLHLCHLLSMHHHHYLSADAAFLGTWVTAFSISFAPTSTCGWVLGVLARWVSVTYWLCGFIPPQTNPPSSVQLYSPLCGTQQDLSAATAARYID